MNTVYNSSFTHLVVLDNEEPVDSSINTKINNASKLANKVSSYMLSPGDFIED